MATLPSIVAKSSITSAQGFVEFKLGMAVLANVQYSVAVSANVNELKVQKQSTKGQQHISYRVPTIVGSRTPTAVIVTLTAASIS